MTLTVTRVTSHAASSDTLTGADYRDIYDELRAKCPLRQFAEQIHSDVSFAWWSKYERGEAVLNRERRNELRLAVGLPALPPTVADVVAAADPDATVYQVGEQPADRIVLVGANAHEPLDLHLNGDLTIESHVTPVTAPRARAATRAVRFSPIAGSASQNAAKSKT